MCVCVCCLCACKCSCCGCVSFGASVDVWVWICACVCGEVVHILCSVAMATDIHPARPTLEVWAPGAHGGGVRGGTWSSSR